MNLLHQKQEIWLAGDYLPGFQCLTVHHPQLPKYKRLRKTAEKDLVRKRQMNIVAKETLTMLNLWHHSSTNLSPFDHWQDADIVSSNFVIEWPAFDILSSFKCTDVKKQHGKGYQHSIFASLKEKKCRRENPFPKSNTSGAQPGGPCMIGDNAPRLHGGMGEVLPAEIDPQIDLFNICFVYCTHFRHPTDDDDPADLLDVFFSNYYYTLQSIHFE